MNQPRLIITPQRLYDNSTPKSKAPIISPDSANKIQIALTNSWAPSTRRNYQCAIQKYIKFCETQRIPRHLHTPAEEIVLCAFAADNVGRLSASTARNQLAAIKAWHLANNWTWKGSHRLTQILRGVHRLTPESSRRPLRPPVNSMMLDLLHQDLNLQTNLDAAIFACACTSFWGQCRLGELLPKSKTSYRRDTLPSRTSIRLSTRNKAAWVVHLPKTKTSHTGQDIILVRQKGNLNPISAIQDHLLRNRVPNNSPLFTYYKNQTPEILTKKTFLDRCNQIWSKHGFPTITGHSFRIGGTSELLLSGVAPDVVKVMGRWSSDSFLKYWRSIEDIAPLHAQNAQHSRAIHH